MLLPTAHQHPTVPMLTPARSVLGAPRKNDVRATNVPPPGPQLPGADPPPAALLGRAGLRILQPYDIEVGAGTFHPATTLRALGPEPWNAAYVQPSRRPTDGRYGENPNRLQHYYQFQVILKPSPPDFQELYLRSLYALGIDPRCTTCASSRTTGRARRWGLGPRLGGLVRRDGGLAVHLLPAGRRLRLPAGFGRADLRARAAGHVRARGRERLRPRFQRPAACATARCSCRPSANIRRSTSRSPTRRSCSATSPTPSGIARLILERGLPLPAYDQCLKASHLFNLLDARGVISVTERAAYIGRVRALAKACAEAWLRAPRHDPGQA